MTEMKKILSNLSNRVIFNVKKSCGKYNNLYKRYSKYSTILSLERSFTTMMGLTLQEIAEKQDNILQLLNGLQHEKPKPKIDETLLPSFTNVIFQMLQLILSFVVFRNLVP